MSAEYLSDREQEEALRNWWKENWSWVLAGVAIGLVLLAAWNFWQRHTEQQKAEAARAYQNFTTSLAANDKNKTDAAVKELESEHSGSPYVDQAHLMLAQSHVNGGRFEMAATELRTVVDKSKDSALVQVAKMRLARVQIQLGHFDEALALLDVSKAGAFAADVNAVRGDALLAKGDTVGAQAAYQAALGVGQGEEGALPPSESEYLRLKLQDLATMTADKSAKDSAPATEKK
jgi:predicted negative regulator of RcsB-dependent stress response